MTWLPLYCNSPKRKKMTDVDALTRRFSPSYHLHLSISFISSQFDRINRPQAYSYDYFKENVQVCIEPTTKAELLPIPVLTLSGIRAYTRNTVTNLTPLLMSSSLQLFHIQSLTVLIFIHYQIHYHSSLPY